MRIRGCLGFTVTQFANIYSSDFLVFSKKCGFLVGIENPACEWFTAFLDNFSGFWFRFCVFGIEYQFNEAIRLARNVNEKKNVVGGERLKNVK